MRNALLVLSIASLAVAQQQGVGPASTIQLQPGQFSVFGQPRQQPVNIPGTQGKWLPSSLTRQARPSPFSSWVSPNSSSSSHSSRGSNQLPSSSSSSGQLPSSSSSSGQHLSSSNLHLQPLSN